MKAEVYIEFGGRKTEHKALVDTAKEIWKNDGNKVKNLSKMELFYKPDENKCYYIFNQDKKGYFEV